VVVYVRTATQYAALQILCYLS